VDLVQLPQQHDEAEIQQEAAGPASHLLLLLLFLKQHAYRITGYFLQ